jgi:hypothetical protein
VGNVSATGNVTGRILTTSGNTGNIFGGNYVVANTLSAIGNVIGNVLFAQDTVSAVGTVISPTLIVGNVLNINSGNGVGNIGNNTNRFNTVFALATSAAYADLAEIYVSDHDYEPGTVVVFGGDQEITQSESRADARVAGAVSTRPAYLMNSDESGVAVALRGRVPVQVVGPVVKGDALITSAVPGHAESIGQLCSYGQAVFAKSLVTDPRVEARIITAVIL